MGEAIPNIPILFIAYCSCDSCVSWFAEAAGGPKVIYEEGAASLPGSHDRFGLCAQWSATLQPNDWHAIADTGDISATPPGHLFSVPTGTNTQLFMRLTVTVQ